MAGLDQSADPRELIPGDPDGLRASAATMTRFGDALVQAGGGLAQVRDGGWTGAAADAFHASFDGQPAKWSACGDAFHSASGALTRYASTLEWAQGRAGTAIELWQQGQEATASARAAYQQQAAQASASGTTLAAFTDPGQELRSQAQDVLASARSEVASAGDEARGTVDAAQSQAPHKPHWWQRIGSDVAGRFDDIVGGAERDVGGFFDTIGNDVATAVGGTVRDVGDGVGATLSDLGHATGWSSLTTAGRDTKSALASAGDDAEDWVRDNAAYVRNELYDAAHAADGRSAEVPIYINPSEYPKTALHIEEAQGGTSWLGNQKYKKTQPSVLTIDRDRRRAEQRSRDALRSVKPDRKVGGNDRDEYPPKMFAQGGEGASVKYVPWQDNQGAGRSMGAQTKGLPDGSLVEIIPK